jgi:phospholipase/carboxylesterase
MRPATPIDEDAVVWSRPAHDRGGRPLVLFLHGYGGDESDWAAWFPQRPAVCGPGSSSSRRSR